VFIIFLWAKGKFSYCRCRRQKRHKEHEFLIEQFVKLRRLTLLQFTWATLRPLMKSVPGWVDHYFFDVQIWWMIHHLRAKLINNFMSVRKNVLFALYSYFSFRLAILLTKPIHLKDYRLVETCSMTLYYLSLICALAFKS